MNKILYWLPILAWTAISIGAPAAWPREEPSGRRDGVEIGLNTRAPADWVEEKPDGTPCYKQYRLEPVGDDVYAAQVTVSFLGKKKGETAAESVKHWRGMFLPPEGKTMQEAAKLRQLTVNGAIATYLDVRGDYKGIPGDDATPREDFRLLGVYFDTSAGPCTVRLFGPAQTVEFYRDGFEDWIKAFRITEVRK